MMNPRDFTYIFGIGMVLAFMDAYGIGANDVANSFATSVASGSLTLAQACIIACFTEFLGAFLLGASVADTIKDGIVPVAAFAERPEMLMLGMMCALAASSTWLLIATRRGWPVSTTHSIVGAVIGMGVASYGPNTVKWGWGGFGSIVASWFISPIASGVIAAIIYSTVKFGVLRRQNPVKWGLYLVPVFFFVTTTIEALYIMLKGAPRTNAKKMPIGHILAIAFGVGGFFFILAVIFYVPWLRRKVVKREDIRWYHVFVIPFLPPRPRVADPETTETSEGGNSIENEKDTKEEPSELSKSGEISVAQAKETTTEVASEEKVLTIKERILNIVLHGVRQDVRTVKGERLKQMHAAAEVFDSDVEYMFSFLQILTAILASFAHGSNDVANAVGPLSAIFNIWESGVADGKTPVPLWVLAYGGIAIDIGMATMGYFIFRRLGNNLTLLTPTRGFSAELGAALTVVTCSQIGVPVSTTHCITGATAAVGLCNGNFKAVNWRMLAWCMFAWVVTVPLTGTLSGCIFAIISNAPSFAPVNPV